MKRKRLARSLAEFARLGIATLAGGLRVGLGRRSSTHDRISNRGIGTLIATALLAIAWSSAFAGADEPARRRPNIILILTDDMGIGDLSCYGGTLAATPNLDRMASEGIRFEQFYTASPICSPSRTGFLTGMFPARWRITSYLQTRAGNAGCEQADFLDPRAPSLARALKGSGYTTAHIGKWHMGGGRDVVDPPPFPAYGFDEHASTWESPDPHPDLTGGDFVWSPNDRVPRWERTAWMVDRTLEFLDRRKDRPCFVNLWPDDVHLPFIPDEASLPPRPATNAAAKAKTKAAAKAKTKAVALDTLERYRAVMKEYDRQIGRLLDGLRSRGIAEHTLVIFTSDNGAWPTYDGARSGGFRGSKLSLYEGGIRMPFLAWWPGTVPAGRVDRSTVIGSVDLFPSLCTIAGAGTPKDAKLDGEDRSAAILGGAIPERSRPLLWEYGRNDRFFVYPKGRDRSPNVAVRRGRWKLLINADGTGAELYDLELDKAETRNLAADRPDQTAELTRIALDWRKSLPVPPARE